MSNIPTGWIMAPLAELTEPDAPIIYGILQPGPETPNGVPYIRPTEIVDDAIDIGSVRRTTPAIAERYRRSALRENDILLSIVGTIGKVAIVPAALNGGNITQSSCRVRPDSKLVERDFIAHVLRSPMVRTQFSDMRLGTAVPRLNLEDVRKIVTPIAPKPEQRRIVATINSLSAKSRRAREHLDHIPRLVEKYKQAILAAAFRGELTREWREKQSGIEPADQLIARTEEPSQSRGGREATTSVKAGIAGLSVNDPGTAPPSGWSWVSLRRIARQETGHTPSRSQPDYWDGGIPWIGIPDAGNHHGQIINNTLQTISKAGLANSSARLLPASTVCLSRTASVGYVTIMGSSMATSQDFATWSCSPALIPKYLMYALMAEGDSIREFGQGSTHTTIYFPEIRALHICLAPLIEQQEIIRRVENALVWVDRIASETTSARKLIDHLDQTVLAKAFRGELVPQDPTDEPAGVLLERIRAEREAKSAASGFTVSKKKVQRKRRGST
jgi:type I restriction enzyme, S subunit